MRNRNNRRSGLTRQNLIATIIIGICISLLSGMMIEFIIRPLKVFFGNERESAKIGILSGILTSDSHLTRIRWKVYQCFGNQ
jgi:hypothetical protein